VGVIESGSFDNTLNNLYKLYKTSTFKGNTRRT